MARLIGQGTCNSECEIDSYFYSSTELSLMTEVAGLEPEPKSSHEKKIEVMHNIAHFHSLVVVNCLRDAARKPCEGYNEVGIKLGRLLSGTTIHCPIVARMYAGESD